MLPESEDYSKELANLIVRNDASQDDIDAKEDIDSFIEELKNILEIVKENKLSDEEAEGIYEKIITMLNEHKEDH